MRILLVDGHSIANRAFYGVPLLSNQKGEYTNALHGFFSILWKNMELTGAEALAVAFDMHAPTFRHKAYPEYKGTRKPMPEELRAQIPVLQEMLNAAGVPLLMQAGLEADDILGTEAFTHQAAGDEVFVLSGDRDLLQLVGEHVTLLIPKTKAGGSETEVYHCAEVEEKYGVSPYGYLQMKALMGDSSDNIPGVPGIGEKTASELIAQYGSLEKLLESTAEITKPKLRANLETYAEQARMSLWLATIKTDAQLEGDVRPMEEISFSDAPFMDYLKRYELRQLMGRVKSFKMAEIAPVSVYKAIQAPELAEIKSPDELPCFEFVGIAVDERGIALSNGEKSYLISLGKPAEPVQASLFDEPVEEGLSLDDAIRSIRPILESGLVKKCCFDSKKLYRLCIRNGIQLNNICLDASLAAYLLNPNKGKYPVEELVRAYLDGELVEGAGPADEAFAAFSLREPLLTALRWNGMMELYESIELPLAEVLAGMEESGIRVSKEFLTEFGRQLASEIADEEKLIYELAGEEFNINSTKQLGDILFDKMGLKGGKKTKSGYSTSVEVLEELKGEAPIIEHILTYRKLSKLKSTYVEGMGAFIGADGKIHSSFNQTVTATGRLSSADPNLQNIPIRTELGRELRRAFLPSSEDYLFVDADYSQIELRLLAHMSGDAKMQEAFCGGSDIHRQTAAQVFHKAPEEVTSRERSAAKTINFGIIYGMSAFSLSQDLGISRAEATQYIADYYAQFPNIESYLNGCIESAKERGYAETLYGRRRPIDELKNSNYVTRSFGERVARNMPIQGTAADIMKLAMIHVDRRLKEEKLKSRILVQVHDELLLEVYRPEKARVTALLKEEMERAAALSVPLLVDVHAGENWYDAK